MVYPETQNRLLRVLKSIPSKHNCSVIHVTHNWDEAYALANRIAVINKGSLVEVGNPQSVFEKPTTQFSAHLTGFQNILAGVATPTDNGSIVDLGHGIRVSSNVKANGVVFVCVRPEWISVDVQDGDNVLIGNVIDTFRERHGVRVLASVNGIEFTILSREDFVVGGKVSFQIPPNVIHLIASDQAT